MTAQTLRVQNRKAEIDRELTIVEEDIRIYSERDPLLYDPSDEFEVDHIPEPSSDPSSDRCLSCGTNRSSTSIGIQTEDITDELYLTNALKK